MRDVRDRKSRQRKTRRGGHAGDRSMRGRIRTWGLGAAVAIAAVTCSSLSAAGQDPQTLAGAQSVRRIPLVAGRSTVLSTSFDVVRIAVTDAAVADATIVRPQEILIDGKAAGIVSLIIWGR